MLIRYPGSKDRAVSRILPLLILDDRRLCEPFAGTAAVTFAALDRRLVDEVWINDADWYISSLWASVRDRYSELQSLVRSYKPHPDDFYAMRQEATADPLRAAFITIVLHQISFSGLGAKAGSPIGGRDQCRINDNGEQVPSKFLVGCRWNPQLIVSEIGRAYWLMRQARSVRITCGPWTQCPSDWEWYVDPPYVEAGEGLYRHGTLDHQSLADHLRERTAPWLLTYEDSDEVKAMYSWATWSEGHETYLNHGRADKPETRASRKRELLITASYRDRRRGVEQPALFADLGDGGG